MPKRRKGIEVDGWQLCIVENEDTGIFIEDLGDSWIIEYPVPADAGVVVEDRGHCKVVAYPDDFEYDRFRKVPKKDMVKSFLGWYTHKTNIQLEQLTKKETQDLEINGTSYINLYRRELNYHEYYTLEESFRFYDWCSAPTIGFKKGVEYLKDILGNPTYHKNYSCRNAVWGLKIDGEPLVFYYSNEGPTFSVSKDCTKVIELYKTLTNLLNGGER